MLFRKGPFFLLKHHSSEDLHLDKLASVLGTDTIKKYMKRYNIELDKGRPKLIEYIMLLT